MPLDDFHPAVAALVPAHVPRADRGAGRRPGPRSVRAAHTLVAAPTGSGKTLTAFLAAIDDLVRRGLRERRPARRDRGRLRLAAEGAVERHPPQPRGAARRHPRRARRAGPARRRDPHRGAHRRHAGSASASRRCASGRRTSWSRRPNRSTCCSARRRAARCWRRVRTVIVDEIHARRRAASAAATSRSSLERLEALCEAARSTRIGLSATQKPIDEVARFLVGAGAVARRRRRLRDRRHRLRQAARPRARAAADAARGGDVERPVGAGLRPRRRARAAAPHDAGLRQHAPHGRARGAPSRRAARQGRGRRAPRQPREGDAPRRRAAPEARRAEGAGRDRVARARPRHRRRRPRLPARLAALDRHLPAARRPLGPRGGRRAEGAALPAVARRAGRMRGAARLRCAAASSTRCTSLPRAARRAGAADRRRDRLPRMGRGRAVRAGAPRLAVRDAVARATSTPSCACSPTASPRATARAARYVHRDAVHHRLRERARRAPDGADLGRHDPRDRRLRASCWSRRRPRSARVNEDFAVESIAGDVFQLGNTQLPHPARSSPGRVRVEDAQGQPPNDPVLARRGAGPHRRAVVRASRACARRSPRARARRRGARGRRAGRARSASTTTRRARSSSTSRARVAALGGLPTHERIVLERFFEQSGWWWWPVAVVGGGGRGGLEHGGHVLSSFRYIPGTRQQQPAAPTPQRWPQPITPPSASSPPLSTTIVEHHQIRRRFRRGGARPARATYYTTAPKISAAISTLQPWPCSLCSDRPAHLHHDARRFCAATITAYHNALQLHLTTLLERVGDGRAGVVRLPRSAGAGAPGAFALARRFTLLGGCAGVGLALSSPPGWDRAIICQRGFPGAGQGDGGLALVRWRCRRSPG